MRWVLFVLPVAMIACGPQAGDSALVLLDSSARAANIELTLGAWSGSPKTPIAANAWDEVKVTTANGEHRLAVEGGTVMVLSGASATVSALSTSDVEGDAVILDAESGAAEEVARKLGAVVTPEGDGRWLLRGAEVLRQTAWLDVPDAVRAVLPKSRKVMAGWAQPAAGVRVPVGVGAGQGSPTLTGDVPAVVGVYTAGENVLVLDASGGFQLSGPCSSTTGNFFIEGSELSMVPVEGPRRVLSLESGAGLSDGLDRFVPLREVTP